MNDVKHMQAIKFFKAAFVMMVLLFCVVFFSSSALHDEIRAIRHSKQQAALFLQHIQRTDGAICDTANPLFATWETILSLTAIYHSDTGTVGTVISKGLAFLKDNENSDGLICHNQKCKKSYCLETTAVYFNLLKLTGNQQNQEGGINKIISLQKQTGQWEIGNPDVLLQKDFPSVTAFALNLLNNSSVTPLYKNQAINWLLQKQHADGSWGAAWEYYGCPAYAMWPVMEVLQNTHTGEAKPAKERAIAFILSSQHANGSWYHSDALQPKQISAALQTALMLLALQNSGLQKHEAVIRGIRFLLATQDKNGSWDGGYFPVPEKRYRKQEYVTATALAAGVMHNYLFNNSH